MVEKLVCLDMDRVLVDHLSTWQFVYDQLGISNDESFELYNQGKLDEWDWIKLDLALIKSSFDHPITDDPSPLIDGRHADDEGLETPDCPPSFPRRQRGHCKWWLTKDCERHCGLLSLESALAEALGGNRPPHRS